ncbi:hypothetical protein MRY82_02435 [bacterium]|nr:hypothetical protein [bacterium]
MRVFFSFLVILSLSACGEASEKNIVLNEAQQEAILEFLATSTHEEIVEAAIVAAVDTSGNSFFASLNCLMNDVDVQGQAQLNLASGNAQWIAQTAGQTRCFLLNNALEIASTQLNWSGENSLLGLGTSQIQGKIYIVLQDLDPQVCDVLLQMNAIVNQVIVEGTLCKIPVQARYDV